MKTVAIIGTTASGKSDAAHEIARKTGAVLLSCDSLAVYKEVDIASAKPAKSEIEDLKYFGLDLIEADKNFGIDDFTKEYKRAEKHCLENGKNLIIVGGSSFYLKSLITGLSTIPDISDDIKMQIKKDLLDTQSAYKKVLEFDRKFLADPNDSYRIEKALTIIYSTNRSPSEWFKKNPPIPIIKNIDIFEIVWEKEIVDSRIRSRTKKMIDSGVVNEAGYLERKYKRDSQVFRSIGLKECLNFFDGKIDLSDLEEQIATHTIQYAKRQRTFNSGQFEKVIRSDYHSIIAQAKQSLT